MNNVKENEHENNTKHYKDENLINKLKNWSKVK